MVREIPNSRHIFQENAAVSMPLTECNKLCLNVELRIQGRIV